MSRRGLSARVIAARDGGPPLTFGESTRIGVALATCRCEEPSPRRPTACAVCGAPLEHPTTGRPRRYCSTGCRRTAEKARRK